MARIRTIKPEFWEDLKVGRLSRDERLLLIYLWYSTNDYGVAKYDFKSCKAGSKMLGYGVKTHYKCINQLIKNEFVEIIDENLLRIIPRKILGISRNNRFSEASIQEWNEIRKVVLRRDNYTCSYCGKKGGELHVDHIHPVSKGGLDELNNLTTACRKCNIQKKDKTLEEFEQWLKKKGYERQLCVLQKFLRGY